MIMLRLALAASLAALMNYESSAAEWEKLPPLPEANGGFICGAIGGEIVIAGGTNWRGETKHWLDQIHAFDPRRGTWREAGRLPAPLAYAACGETREGLVFAGGSSGAESHGSLWRLDRQFAVQPLAPLEQRFVYGASAVLGGELFVIGGAADQAKLETASNHCHAIDVRTGKSRRLADLPAPSFITGAAAACGGRVYVFGGARWDAVSGAASNLAGAFTYTPAENRWEVLKPLPSANRGLVAVTLDDRHILIAGGYKNDVEEFTDEALLFDVERGEYRRTVALPYRSLVALVKLRDHVYCLGGEDRKKHRTDACYRIAAEALLKAAR